MAALPMAIRHDTYYGLAPYGVQIDQSEELTALIEQARMVKDSPQDEKLARIRDIAREAMSNAWEEQYNAEDPDRQQLCKDLIYRAHPLGDALKNKLGCCRYQAVLFFILGFEADLGNHHFLQSNYLNQERSGVRTCFNEGIINNQRVAVSVFLDSLKVKDEDGAGYKYDYTKGQNIFQNPVPASPMEKMRLREDPFFAYHRVEEGDNRALRIYETQGAHHGISADGFYIFEPPETWIKELNILR